MRTPPGPRPSTATAGRAGRRQDSPSTPRHRIRASATCPPKSPVTVPACSPRHATRRPCRDTRRRASAGVGGSWRGRSGHEHVPAEGARPCRLVSRGSSSPVPLDRRPGRGTVEASSDLARKEAPRRRHRRDPRRHRRGPRDQRRRSSSAGSSRRAASDALPRRARTRVRRRSRAGSTPSGPCDDHGVARGGPR